MIDYLAIATQAAADLDPRASTYQLLNLSDVEMKRLLRKIAEGAAMDLQMAIDNAYRVGQLYDVAGQLPMFRMAA